jgi:hypothetical protein
MGRILVVVALALGACGGARVASRSATPATLAAGKEEPAIDMDGGLVRGDDDAGAPPPDAGALPIVPIPDAGMAPQPL